MIELDAWRVEECGVDRRSKRTTAIEAVVTLLSNQSFARCRPCLWPERFPRVLLLFVHLASTPSTHPPPGRVRSTRTRTTAHEPAQMRILLNKAWNAVQPMSGDHRATLPTYDSVPGEPASDEKLSPWAAPFRSLSSSRSSSRSASPDTDYEMAARQATNKGWIRLGAAGLCGLVAGVLLARGGAHDSAHYDGPTRTDVWKQYNIQEKSLVGTRPITRLPKCERTVVLEWVRAGAFFARVISPPCAWSLTRFLSSRRKHGNMVSDRPPLAQ